MTACIGEPISWLRLEGFALGAPDPAIASHVAACPACRACLAQIRQDEVTLPPLALPARQPRLLARRRWMAPAFAAVAAAAVLVVVLRRPAPGDPESMRASRSTVGVKGVGEVTLALVRERGGAISYDARGYAPGDRWKIVVSCPPGAAAGPLWIDVSVADGTTIDHPIGPTQLGCGNRVVVPGAFTITGGGVNRVCARIAAAPGADAGTACLTLHPD